MEEQTGAADGNTPSKEADGVDAFGRWLRRERELRGLPREEVARLTKLAPGVIEALESGEANRMPPRAYLLGYLRSYAMAVGLDADDAVLRWQEIEAGFEPQTTPRNAAPRQWGPVVVIGLVVGLVAAVLVVLARCSS